MGISKENKKYLIGLHRCIECHKIDAYTLSGKAKCYECLEKDRERSAIYREKNHDLVNQKQKELRKRWKEEHKCSRCGNKLPENYGFLLCNRCRIETRKNKNNRTLLSGVNLPRGDNGICWQCNKNPVIEGKRLCFDCYKSKMKLLEKAMERNREVKKHEKAE